MAIPEASLRPVLARLTPLLQTHLSLPAPRPPFFIALAGLQGSGKSTWASALSASLSAPPLSLRVVAVSLDDFYHAHATLARLRDADPSNALRRTRGQPGTHDEALAAAFFDGVMAGKGEGEVKVPAFDKSRFDGEGDRVPAYQWKVVELPIDVVVFEGWCVGFRPLPEGELRERWERAVREKRSDSDGDGDDDAGGSMSVHTLADHAAAHLLQVNADLARYCATFMRADRVDFFVHLDTDDLRNVYRWRIDQEHALWKAKGQGMSDEAVTRFVRGYMPSYELFLDGLRSRPFVKSGGTHLRVVLDAERRVVKVEAVGGD